MNVGGSPSEAFVARLAEVRAATSPRRPDATRAALAADDLDPAEVDIAMAAGRRAPGLLPEDLEGPAGRSERSGRPTLSRR